MGVLLSTTGLVGSVTINDFGGREFIHPVVDYVLTDEFTYQELRESEGLASALDSGYISLKYSTGNVIGTSAELAVLEPVLDAGGASPSQIGGGAASMVITMASGSTKHVETTSSTYESLSHFIYGGSDEIGAILNININVWGVGTNSVNARLFDLTNGNVIAELINITSSLESNVQSMGTISNLPTAAAVIEIQGRKNTGGGAAKMRIGSLEIQY